MADSSTQCLGCGGLSGHSGWITREQKGPPAVSRTGTDRFAIPLRYLPSAVLNTEAVSVGLAS